MEHSEILYLEIECELCIILKLSYEQFFVYFTSRSTDGQIVEIEIRNIDIITKLNQLILVCCSYIIERFRRISSKNLSEEFQT